MKTAIATLLVLVAATAGCVEERALVEKTGSFRVEVTADLGTPESLIPFPDEPITVDVKVTALSNRGGTRESFQGPVSLVVQPGRIAGSRPGPVTLDLVNGVGETSVSIDRIYGSTHICAEDKYGEEPSYAVGCSPRFHVAMPSIRQTQLTDDNTTSPMDKAFIDIRSGDMIVTGVFAEGFFVTDLEAGEFPGRPGDFDSIFVFNFSYPDGIFVGDRLDSISGTVQVFVGSTQLVFPSWIHRPDTEPSRDDMPVPFELTSEICAAATSGPTVGLCGHQTSNIDMESLEASLVKISRVRTPSNWVDCDYNRDGNLINYDPACNESPVDPAIELHCAEIECKTACNMDKTCSELSSYRTYGQWAVAMDEGLGPKINVLTRDGVPEFDPLAEENQGILIDVSGPLRQSLPARPRWIVLARDGDDFVIHQD